MKHLWAPWRIEYILAEKDRACLFCRVFQEGDDRRNLVLVRESRCLAMLNRYPYNSGHILIAPLSHRSRLADLAPEDLAAMMGLAQRMERLLAATMKPEGFNVGMNLGKTAGAGIEEHLHLHIVPRWNGDTNFMPILDDVRVVPQALSDLYDHLLAGMAKGERSP